MKTILSTSAPKPFTIERDGNGILLQLHVNSMRFGKTSTVWLLQALKKINHERQLLQHEGVTLIEVFSDSGHAYIIGQNSRFTMRSDVLQKMVQWLENYLSDNTAL